MKDYIFILGRDQELGLLELVSYFRRKNIHFSIKKRFQEAVLISLFGLDMRKVIKELGGIVKIAEVIDLDDAKYEFQDAIYYGNKNKITYGISYINCNPEPLMERLKKVFKKEKIKATYRRSESNIISPSKSLNLDLELVYFNKIIGIVMANSNPKEYRERDEVRPRFDRLKVTSIRLAKILINLGQAKQEILDPFCGNGTILQEALIMGFKVIGIDKDVRDAEINLRWLGKNDYRLIRGDASRLSKYVKAAETIVTEPYMGPYLKKIPTKEEAEKTIKELRDIYYRFLKEAYYVVKDKIVMMVPDIRTYTGKVELGFERIIQSTGFRIYSPYEKIKMPVAYFDSEDRVQRKIYVLEKQ